MLFKALFSLIFFGVFGTFLYQMVESFSKKSGNASLKLPEPYGYLKGKLSPTLGMNGRKPKMYKVFRNIPYALPITKENRFRQSEPLPKDYPILGPSESQPYDATRSGPLCSQGEMNPDNMTALFNHNNIDLINWVLENIPEEKRQRFDINADWILSLVGKIFNIDNLPLSNMTLAETVHQWLDMDVSMSEDCLHLTVSTPDKPAPEGGFPVMFFVHGGAFSSGTHIHSEADRLGDVADVIVVSINYRIGVLGFLCLDTEESAGNQGMLDILLALEWVQEYIEYFGGNKKRVTIFGESAGSAAIGHLLLSPATKDKNLFLNGIGQSGSAISPWAFDHNPRKGAYEFAERLGCLHHEASDKELVECLRQFEAWEIAAEFSRYTTDRRKGMDLGFGASSPCGQTQGKRVFYGEKDDPFSLLVKGNYSKDVNIFFGNNLFEGTYAFNLLYNAFLLPNNYTIQNARTRDYLKYEFLDSINRAVNFKGGYAVENVIRETYFTKDVVFGDLRSMTPGLVDYLGLLVLKASSYDMMSKHAKNGGKAYWYSLEYSGQKSVCHLLSIATEAPEIEKFGACHGDELMFLFDYEFPLILCDVRKLIEDAAETMLECFPNIDCMAEKVRKRHAECLDGTLTDEEMILAESMAKAWTNFAINGDPNGGGLPHLKPWDRSEQTFLIFDIPNYISHDYTAKYINSQSHHGK